MLQSQTALAHTQTLRQIDSLQAWTITVTDI